ncbi:MAG: right-handed parallel beta-helix repeat-containing protein, partial [Deltaproteobacteria bacterium]|nr:right-handed parallel beta-helix repeat-containing protein [Deltaproteobacteria bacterium]
MQKRNLLGLTLIGLFLAIGLIVPAAATQHYWVDDDGSNATGDGSESNPWRTITRVLTDGSIEGSSSDRVIIHVKAGTYSPSMHSSEYETFPLQMWSYFSIQGEGGREYTIIDAERTELVIGCFHENYISVSGVTITGGAASINGGGLTINAADYVAVDDCIITDNQGAYGGGGYVVTGSNDVSFTNCVISHNTSSSHGGGIYCLVLVEITDCVFEDNETSGRGGGVYISSNTIVDHCDFIDNRAAIGGGITVNGSAHIRYCTFDNNEASDDSVAGGGGGIFCAGSSSWPRISGCEMYYNTAVRGGAVMIVNQAEPTIVSCEIYNNTASKSGGGIYCSTDIDYEGDGDASITYCNIHDNEATSENGGGILIQERVTLSLGGCVIEENLATSGNGGGVYCYDHVNLELNSNIIYHNTAGGGGGVYAERECDVDFKGFDRITYNIATFGAGIYFSGDSSNPVGGSIFNTVIAHNDSNGIRFMNTYNSVEILNCTIYSNANVGVLAVGEAPVTLTNCIIWNNGDDISGVSCDD